YCDEHLQIAESSELGELLAVEWRAQRLKGAREDLGYDSNAHASCKLVLFTAMRIVHVVQGLGTGGQERMIIQLCHELVSRGHEPVIVSLSPDGQVRREAQNVPIYDAARADRADVSLVPRLALLFRRMRADVVHTHNP